MKNIFRWATLLRRDGGLCASARRARGISQRQKIVGSALAQQGHADCFFFARRERRCSAVGERDKGGSRRLRNTGRCAPTASRKNGLPVSAAVSFAP